MFIDKIAPVPFPYPERFGTLGDFRYETGLVLLRLRDAVKMRGGREADYIVGADYTVSLAVDGRRMRITVPAGMLTDLTSVPWFARAVIGRVGPHLEAAILHDYLYAAWQDEGRAPRLYQRRFADAVMLEAMRASHVSRWGRNAIFLAVRAFGGRYFATRREERYIDLSQPEIAEQFPRLVVNYLARAGAEQVPVSE